MNKIILKCILNVIIIYTCINIVELKNLHNIFYAIMIYNYKNILDLILIRTIYIKWVKSYLKNNNTLTANKIDLIYLTDSLNMFRLG